MFIGSRPSMVLRPSGAECAADRTDRSFRPAGARPVGNAGTIDMASLRDGGGSDRTKPDLRPACKKGKQLHQFFSDVLPAPAHSQSVPPSADRFNGIRGAVRTSRPRPPGTELHWLGASQFLATVLRVSPRPRPGGAAQGQRPRSATPPTAQAPTARFIRPAGFVPSAQEA